MHTNYDKCVLNRYVLSEILGFSEFESDGEFLLKFRPNLPFGKLCELVKKRLEIPQLRVCGESDKFIATCALCTGSGAEFAHDLRADCLITGDIKYHAAFAAAHDEVSLIDAGHFESERYFGASLAPLLQKNQIFAKIATSINPFHYV